MWSSYESTTFRLGRRLLRWERDVTLLARSAEKLAQVFKGDDAAKLQTAGSVY